MKRIYRIGNLQVCRICYSTGDLRSLMNPCQCSGTMGILHRTCLERWLEISNTTKCEICQHEFEIIRYPKSLLYVSRSLPNRRRNFFQILVSNKSITSIGYSLFDK
jgi:hypothetical protein